MDLLGLENIFFELLQVAVGNRRGMSRQVSLKEWAGLFKLCKKQSLPGIGYAAINRLPKEQNPMLLSFGEDKKTAIRLLGRWSLEADKIAKANKQLSAECVKLSEQLIKDGFHCCILKGQGNLANYPDWLRDYRSPGDIDILVRPVNSYKGYTGIRGTIEYCIEQCHVYNVPVGKICYHHMDMPWDGKSEVEVHHRATWMDSYIRNRRLQTWLENNMPFSNNNTSREAAKVGFPVPPASYNAVYQLIHIYRHLYEGGIGLRQILDYYFALEAFHEEGCSKEEAMHVLRGVGLYKFSGALMYVLQKVFAMPDEYMICPVNVKEGEFLFKEIMMAGNFGKYDTRMRHGTSAVSHNAEKLSHNLRLIRHYPEEVSIEPIFRIYHFIWRMFKLWRWKFVPLLLLLTTVSYGQTPISRIEGLELNAEMQESFSDGNTPLWLNANKYGVSSLKSNNGYLRVSAERKLENDSLHKWGIAYGADVYVAYHHLQTFNLQQLYFKGRYGVASLTIGQKQEPMNLKPEELSSGSQTLGINSRPVPSVRIAIDDYWNIPGLKQWLGFRFHFAYGICTDGGWQEDFAKGHGRYNKNTLLHTKSGFLRFGSTKHPLTVEAGLEMATQFGGTTYNSDGSIAYENDKSLGAFFKAIYGGKSQRDGGYYYSGEGNIFGSWMLRINYDKPSFYIGTYFDQYFDDDSQLWHIDYDGYGKGSEWMEHKTNDYIFYPFKDILWGWEVKLKKFKPINHFVAEFMHTKYQSGPIFHDHSINIPDHIAGADDYMNHFVYMSWSHWGQVGGNPLYSSPIYNTDGSLYVADNRFIAWHFGIAGDPLEDLHYRVMATIQTGWGTYDNPYYHKEHNFSFMAECSYNFNKLVKGLSVKGAFGLDHGEILGNNVGGQLTVMYNIKRW